MSDISIINDKVEINTKVCLKCHIEKPFSEFDKSRTGKFALHNFCRICLKIYNKEQYQKQKEDRKLLAKEWNAKHAEETKIYKLRSYYKKTGGKMPKLKTEEKPKKIIKPNPLADLPPIDPELNF